MRTTSLEPCLPVMGILRPPVATIALASVSEITEPPMVADNGPFGTSGSESELSQEVRKIILPMKRILMQHFKVFIFRFSYVQLKFKVILELDAGLFLLLN